MVPLNESNSDHSTLIVLENHDESQTCVIRRVDEDFELWEVFLDVRYCENGDVYNLQESIDVTKSLRFLYSD